MASKLATFPLELNKKILFKTLSTQKPATVILRKFAAELSNEYIAVLVLTLHF